MTILFISDKLVQLYNHKIVCEKFHSFDRLPAKLFNFDENCCVFNIWFGNLGFIYQCKEISKKYDISGD